MKECAISNQLFFAVAIVSLKVSRYWLDFDIADLNMVTGLDFEVTDQRAGSNCALRAQP